MASLSLAVFPSAAAAATTAAAGGASAASSLASLESHLLSLTPQQLFSAVSSVLSSPLASSSAALLSSRSRKRRRSHHSAAAAVDGEGAALDQPPAHSHTHLNSLTRAVSSGDDELNSAGHTADDGGAVVFPVSSSWLRVACDCTVRLCTAQLQRATQRTRKQQPPQAAAVAAGQQHGRAQSEACSGSPCVSYLCSLHVLLSTHCVSLSACPQLLPLTLHCADTHPQLIRALLTTTHDWSEEQIVRALKHALHSAEANTPKAGAQQADGEEWRTHHTLSVSAHNSALSPPAAPHVQA